MLRLCMWEVGKGEGYNIIMKYSFMIIVLDICFAAMIDKGFHNLYHQAQTGVLAQEDSVDSLLFRMQVREELLQCKRQ